MDEHTSSGRNELAASLREKADHASSEDERESLLASAAEVEGQSLLGSAEPRAGVTR